MRYFNFRYINNKGNPRTRQTRSNRTVTNEMGRETPKKRRGVVAEERPSASPSLKKKSKASLTTKAKTQKAS